MKIDGTSTYPPEASLVYVNTQTEELEYLVTFMGGIDRRVGHIGVTSASATFHPHPKCRFRLPQLRMSVQNPTGSPLRHADRDIFGG